MQNTKSSILGISLGTRIVGVAVLCENELVEWKVLTFKNTWSLKKRSEILYSISHILKTYGVDRISTKKISPTRASLHFLDIERYFIRLCKSKNISIKQFSIEQIRSFQEYATHKLEDELIFEQSRQQQINTPYYAKVFEAVALAQMGDEEDNMFRAKKSH